MGKAITIYLVPEPYIELKEILKDRFKKPVSQEINEFVVKRLAELKGQSSSAVVMVNYEKLKQMHTRLTHETDILEKRLIKWGVYDKLVELVKDLGLDTDTLSNLNEVAPRLLAKWVGGPEFPHQFITLLETVREKKETEVELAKMRMGRAAE